MKISAGRDSQKKQRCFVHSIGLENVASPAMAGSLEFTGIGSGIDAEEVLEHYFAHHKNDKRLI